MSSEKSENSFVQKNSKNLENTSSPSPLPLLSSYNIGETRRILKNTIVISFSFTLLFTAVSISNLQSSINYEDGLGGYTLTTMYVTLVLSCMFLPTFLIQKFTVKKTLLVSMVGYGIYIGAQFYPKFWTMIPAAILVGFCGAPLWSAKCTYLSRIGQEYSNLVDESVEIIIVRFFGIFFMIFQSSQIWGNLISSTILSFGDDGNNTKDISVCGVNFCPSDATSGGTLERPDDWKINTLAGVFMTCAFTAIIIVILFVDPLTRYGEKTRNENSIVTSGMDNLCATFHQMKNPSQILLIPITIWSGMEQGFFGADFTQAYISCSWGVQHIGYIMICYGISDSIGSFAFGPLIKYTGRIPIFIFGAILNGSIIAVLFLWSPGPTTSIIFFIIAGVWGVADAIWQTQINALYGILFAKNEEAAFSNYRLWEAIGYIIAYVNTNQICINAKLYTLVGVISTGMIGYLIAEYFEKKKIRSNTTTAGSNDVSRL